MGVEGRFILLLSWTQYLDPLGKPICIIKHTVRRVKQFVKPQMAKRATVLHGTILGGRHLASAYTIALMPFRCFLLDWIILRPVMEPCALFSR